MRILSTFVHNVGRILVSVRLLILQGVGPFDVLLEAWTPCILDPWLKDWIKTHKDEPGGLNGELAQYDLLAHALTIKINITKIEDLHAALRRRLYMIGQQANAEDFVEVASEFILGRVTHNVQVHPRPCIFKATEGRL